MAAGCVVIAPNVIGVTEIIDHGVNGFLYELKENELSNFLKNVNDYKLNEISEMAKKYILENHDINIIGTHLEDKFIDELNNNNNFHPGLKTKISKEINFLKFEKFNVLFKSKIDPETGSCATKIQHSLGIKSCI